MRMLSAVLVATALVAGAANAQMKQPAQPPTANVSASPVVMSTEPPLEAAKRIPREDAIKMIKEHKAVWIDVRPRDQYDQGHIAGALSFPLAELPEKMKDLPKNKYLITYCAWQNEHTSARAVLDLNAKGIKNTAALLGGWNGWVAANLPVEKTELK